MFMPTFSALSSQAARAVNCATWGFCLPIAFPIDGDRALDDLFVRFLGGRALYEDCCVSSRIDDDPAEPNGLSSAERLAIWIYSSTDQHWYERINGELWSPSCSTEVQQFSEILNVALRKLPTHDGIVHRGYYAADLDEFCETYDVGIVVRWPGFTSTSAVREEAFPGNVLFTIRSYSGRILGLYADKPSEREILFPSGTRYRVTFMERDDDVVVIELEEYAA
ncbi:MAG TPA: ADP-ribosyltransferase domain-containing protein [Bradyrhizobium sp.]|uniref:ADP-ribosyltransferase domain-containing protein n=1 Tax=Bradyrhizobium sp. TaxID=376 RepID=UPI002C5D1330|nr:ADP-ribosyltransferase domain-containing protein [Bradyrhizobium sp.]HLZ05063.1 ADP-ribosyltransferase domain-containing protein [Bradyrhizobium sp.]